MTHKLTILALDAVVPLDLAIAAQLMGYPMAPYDVTICGLRLGRVTTTSGFAAAVSHGPASCTSTRARCSPRPGWRRASTCACT